MIISSVGTLWWIINLKHVFLELLLIYTRFCITQQAATHDQDLNGLRVAGKSDTLPYRTLTLPKDTRYVTQLKSLSSH